MSQMMPPDLSSLIGGGAGAPAGGSPAGGGMPPDLSQLMGGGAAPADAPLPSDGQHGGGQDPLEQAIALLDQAIAAEADQEDQQVMRQCSAKLQQVLAKNQKEADSAMGGNLPPAAARKMAGSL